MRPDYLKPVNFPIIARNVSNTVKKPLIGKKEVLRIIQISIIVMYIIAMVMKDLEILRWMMLMIVFFVTFLTFKDLIWKKKESVVYLKSKNRIRLEIDRIVVKENENVQEFELLDLSDIKIEYSGHARKRYNDSDFTDTGLGNYISFKHKGSLFTYEFYLDNLTWVKLFDRILFKWGWEGTETAIYQNGVRISKLPVD